MRFGDNRNGSTDIMGIATALPGRSISQSDSMVHASSLLCRDKKDMRVLEQLYRKTEIDSRSSVLLEDRFDPNVHFGFFPLKGNDCVSGPGTAERMKRYNIAAGPLASRSAELAIRNARIDPAEITHLITVSCTGFAAPGFDFELVSNLGLSQQVKRTNVSFMGCHGVFNALRVADAFCQSDPSACVLLNATELCSLHFQYEWKADNLLANSLFADGSASLILRSGVAEARSAGGLRCVDFQSLIIPGSADVMSWTITDHGFKMTLSSKLPDLIAEHLPKWINAWLDSRKLSLSDISGWIVHPGGPKILDAVEACLGLEQAKLISSRQILAECGNMSSPTVLFILERLLAESVPAPYVMLGFGPGLQFEASLLC